jgi:hypothetical protein
MHGPPACKEVFQLVGVRDEWSFKLPSWLGKIPAESSDSEWSKSVALLVSGGVGYLDGLLLEALVFFGEAGEEEGVGYCRFALSY